MQSVKMEKKKDDLRLFYGLTLVILPTIIMAIVSQYLTNFFVRSIAQVLTLFLQAVVVHGILENKYAID